MIQGPEIDPVNDESDFLATGNIDQDITDLITELEDKNKRNYKEKKLFDDLSSHIDADEIKYFRLAKLCLFLGYKRELFLYLGIIVESKLNGVLQEYIANNWQTPARYTDKPTRDSTFQHFRDRDSLDGKATKLEALDLFNDVKTSRRIKAQIQSLTLLRNFGGHPALHDFSDHLIEKNFEKEFADACALINAILAAKSCLISNPPPVI